MLGRDFSFQQKQNENNTDGDAKGIRLFFISDWLTTRRKRVDLLGLVVMMTTMMTCQACVELEGEEVMSERITWRTGAASFVERALLIVVAREVFHTNPTRKDSEASVEGKGSGRHCHVRTSRVAAVLDSNSACLWIRL